MKINEQDIINFILNYGEIYNVKFKDIEYVGIERVCQHASNQMVAKTAYMKGANACLEEHVNAEEALHDFFGDGAFDYLYDRVE